LEATNERISLAWNASKEKLRLLNAAITKTKSMLANVERDCYRAFLASNSGKFLVQQIDVCGNKEIEVALKAFFDLQYPNDKVHEGTMMELVNTAFCNPIRDAIADRKSGKYRETALADADEESIERRAPSKTEGGEALTPADTVRAIFQSWDADGNGQLEKGEFVKLFVHLGLSQGDATAIFEVVDIDHSGGIDYEEFLDWILFSGKSAYTCGFGNSKAAAKSVRAHGEVEAVAEAEARGRRVMCSFSHQTAAVLECTVCNKYFSQAGFQVTHADGEMKGHTTRALDLGRFGGTKEAGNGAAKTGMAMELVNAAGLAHTEEAKALTRELKDQFRVYDLDGNGNISEQEMTQIVLAMAKFCGQGMDADKAALQVHKLFNRLDANNDGVISINEFVDKMVADAMDPNSFNYGVDQAAKNTKEFTANLRKAMKAAGMEHKHPDPEFSA